LKLKNNINDEISSDIEKKPRDGGLQESTKKIKVLVGLDSMGCNIFISRYNVKIPKGS